MEVFIKMFPDSSLRYNILQANPAIERNIANYKGFYLLYWIPSFEVLNIFVSDLLKD